MGVDFTIVEGKGPKILQPIKGEDDVDRIAVLGDVDGQVPFLGPILRVRT
jgi:uroporphyrinogen-III decarboxylase